MTATTDAAPAVQTRRRRALRWLAIAAGVCTLLTIAVALVIGARTFAWSDLPPLIDRMSAWRESPQFSEEERIILAMTEEITFISREGLTDETYGKAVRQFGLNGTGQLIMAINIINVWNRIGISTRRIPGE